MKSTAQKAQRIIAAAIAVAQAKKRHDIESRLEEFEIHWEGYSEPGYTEPKNGVIITGNYNDCNFYNDQNPDNTISRAASLLEKIGCELEWGDEWTTCQECQKLVRVSPDSYSYTPSYAVLNECELLCHECIKADEATRAAYLDTLRNNPRQANTLLTDEELESTGYARYNEDSFENGFHPGQNADPKTIARELKEKGVTDLIFSIDCNSQFTTSFSVWTRNESEEN